MIFKQFHEPEPGHAPEHLSQLERDHSRGEDPLMLLSGGMLPAGKAPHKDPPPIRPPGPGHPPVKPPGPDEPPVEPPGPGKTPVEPPDPGEPPVGPPDKPPPVQTACRPPAHEDALPPAPGSPSPGYPFAVVCGETAPVPATCIC